MQRQMRSESLIICTLFSSQIWNDDSHCLSAVCATLRCTELLLARVQIIFRSTAGRRLPTCMSQSRMLADHRNSAKAKGLSTPRAFIPHRREKEPAAIDPSTKPYHSRRIGHVPMQRTPLWPAEHRRLAGQQLDRHSLLLSQASLFKLCSAPLLSLHSQHHSKPPLLTPPHPHPRTPCPPSMLRSRVHAETSDHASQQSHRRNSQAYIRTFQSVNQSSPSTQFPSKSDSSDLELLALLKDFIELLPQLDDRCPRLVQLEWLKRGKHRRSSSRATESFLFGASPRSDRLDQREANAIHGGPGVSRSRSG
jgi:hypothetical protein